MKENQKKLVAYLRTNPERPKKINKFYDQYIEVTGDDLQIEAFRYVLSKFDKGDFDNEPVAKPKEFRIKVEKSALVNQPEFPLVISSIRLRDSIDAQDFTPLRTGTLVDKFFSDHTEEGGIVSGIYIVVGDPGVGKTTVLADICLRIEKRNPGAETLFCNGEMARKDFAYEALKNDTLNDLNMMFFSDYENHDPLLVLEEFFKKGYKIIALDSFKVILDRIRLMKALQGVKLTENQVESMLINLMKKYNEMNGTIFLVIQQINKGGDFVGSKALEHDTTGMLEMRHTKNGKRFIMFSKNRRNGSLIKTPLYFFKNDLGEIEFDEKDFNMRVQSKEIAKQNDLGLKELEKSFDELLNTSGGVKVNFNELGNAVIQNEVLEDAENVIM